MRTQWEDCIRRSVPAQNISESDGTTTNRILEKFYDAQYIDLRDGKKKNGSQLSYGRTNRSESRCGEKNERIYRTRRAAKILKNDKISVSHGRRSIRMTRCPFKPGDFAWIDGKRYIVRSPKNHATRLLLERGKEVAVTQVEKTVHAGGWIQF